jgi:hypothetical protein
VVVFAAMSNRHRDIEPLVPKALEVLAKPQPGTAVYSAECFKAANAGSLSFFVVRSHTATAL